MLVAVVEGVSIHAPARGATHGIVTLVTDLQFQSTRPRGARRRLPAVGAGAGSFNPRAREGRDLSRDAQCRRCAVSIHAPARGATIFRGGSAADSRLSIHAPARGATMCSASLRRHDRNFNPRAREGRDE